MTSSTIVLCLLVLALQSSSAAPVTQLRAPVERAGFTILTPYDSLQAFLHSLAALPGATLLHLARSSDGRAVDALHFTSSTPSDPARLRVLIFAQQHGDEPSGKEALCMLAARLADGSSDDLLRRVDIMLVPQMNPDGAESRERRTADSIDQNRSHLLLSTPEVRGLHELFVSWMPHVTVDVHEYSALSRNWVEEGIVRAADVQMGMLTNLNVPLPLRAYQAEVILPGVARCMERSGYLLHEYIVGSPQGRIRHSTTEINDGRQSFGILNTLSFIQEGRQEETLEKTLERRVRSQLTALEALLEICAERAEEIRSLVEGERTRSGSREGATFITVMEHEPGRRALRIPVLAGDGVGVESWAVTPYHGEVRALAQERLPAGYLVPDSLRVIVELLRSHGVESQALQSDSLLEVGLYLLDSVWTEELEEQPHLRVRYRVLDSTLTLAPDHWLIPLDQPSALLIATFLEPSSMWGISRYEQFAVLYRHSIFPVLRLRSAP